jgi:hypothetical protein
VTENFPFVKGKSEWEPGAGREETDLLYSVSFQTPISCNERRHRQFDYGLCRTGCIELCTFCPLGLTHIQLRFSCRCTAEKALRLSMLSLETMFDDTTPARQDALAAPLPVFPTWASSSLSALKHL